MEPSGSLTRSRAIVSRLWATIPFCTPTAAWHRSCIVRPIVFMPSSLRPVGIDMPAASGPWACSRWRILIEGCALRPREVAAAKSPNLTFASADEAHAPHGRNSRARGPTSGSTASFEDIQ